MTVSSTNRKAGPFNGNGVTTQFPFTFKVFDDTDVLVVLTDSDGVEVEQALTTHYTISLNANQDTNPGGTITMLAAPATGYRLTSTSQVPNLQPTDITNGGGFYPMVIEDAIDRGVIQVQQLTESVNRSMVMPLSSDLASFQLAEGATAAGRADRVIGFDESGAPTLHYASGTTQLGIDLASTASGKGAALLGFDGGTLADFMKSKNSRVVDSIAALKALDKGVFTRAIVTGYTSSGDGGGGPYWYDSTDVVSADNGGTTIVAADGGRWKLGHQNSITVDQFGAAGDDSTDATAAINAALASGVKHIRLSPGKVYRVTALTLAGSDVTIEIPAGAAIRGTVATNKILTVSGSRCALIGAGKIYGPATFDGANARPTYAVVWVTGDNFFANGITFDTIPKEGLMFEDSTGHRVEGCRFIGNYPYASYNEATTTNHCGIMYNTPAVASNSKPVLTVVGNHFESCIQGILAANYDAASNNTGVTVVGNTFKNCWDHGVYMSRGLGHNISSNVFVSCRRPIVSDGVGSVVCGNVLYSGETGVSNAEQTISVREASNSVITGNSIYGVDAAILCDCIETTVMNNNLIAENVIVSTGFAFATSGIRLGVGAQTCQDNVIRDNTIVSSYWGETGAGIELSIFTGFFGARTRVCGNTIIRGDYGYGVNANRHAYVEISGNAVSLSGSAGGAKTVDLILVDGASYPSITNNRLFYTSGGANVTARGVHVGAGCALPKIKDNELYLTSGTLAARSPYVLDVTSDVSRNLLDPGARMNGTFTWTSATASFAVANTNARADSIITVTPLNVGAAAVVRDKGYYITRAAGQFTIATAGGDATASASDWSYSIE